MKIEQIMTPKKFKAFVEKELDELQAIDVVYVDVAKLTLVADGMWITTGRSKRHVQAIAENLVEKLKDYAMPALSMSGFENSDWILVDCGNYLVHIMSPAYRELYQLEDLWKGVESKR